MSERINQIMRGDRAFEGPVVVKIAETNNVCSLTAGVRAPPGIAAEVRDYLRGARSTPGGSTQVTE